MSELVDRVEHLRSGLTGLNAPLPRGVARGERGRERRWNLSRALAAELVAGHARAGFDRANEVGLRFHVRRKAVAVWSSSRELALVGNLEQREPVAGGIVRRGRARIGRRHGGEIQRFSNGVLLI